MIKQFENGYTVYFMDNEIFFYTKEDAEAFVAVMDQIEEV